MQLVMLLERSGAGAGIDRATYELAVKQIGAMNRAHAKHHLILAWECESKQSFREIMHSLRTKSLLFMVAALCFVVPRGSALAADPSHTTAEATAAGVSNTVHEQGEHGLPQNAVEIGRVLDFPITNSMVVTWIVVLGLLVFAQIATRRMQPVPNGAQNLWEWLVEGLENFLAGVIGDHLAKRTFWFFATVFIFILCTNWAGLIPGVGTVGWGHQTSEGFRVEQPFFRGANADLNLTLAMALIFFACWICWALREVGVLGFYKELFAPKGESTGFLKVLLIVVFFAAGCLEVISILFRPVSLSFRLYGNIFAGENMLETMGKLIPGFGWLLPIPFYFLELLVGIVQALVFMLLTAVFTLLICQHEAHPKEPAKATG